MRHHALGVIEVVRMLRLPLQEMACQKFPLQAEALGVREVFQAVGEEAPCQAGHGKATGAPILGDAGSCKRRHPWGWSDAWSCWGLWAADGPASSVRRAARAGSCASSFHAELRGVAGSRTFRRFRWRLPRASGRDTV